MDDILRAAGVSAGGAYRYFASKDEIVAAVAADSVSTITDAIGQIGAASPEMSLDQAIGRLVLHVDQIADGPGRLALMVWGEAQSDPAIAALTRAEATRIRAAITDLVRRTRRHDALQSLPPEELGSVLFSLIAGFLMQRRVIGDVSAQVFAGTAQSILGAWPASATSPSRAQDADF